MLKIRDLGYKIAISFLIFITVVALLAPFIAPYSPQEINLDLKLNPPSWEHWLGTDHLGRDVLSRLIYGSRISIGLSLIITVTTLLIGIPVGLAVGIIGGKAEKIFMWVADVIMAFPTFLLSMAMAGILGEGIGNIIIAVTVVDWVFYSRILRNMIYYIKNREYVINARLMGANYFYITIKHILPFVYKPIMILALVNVGNVILMISGFSFLGIGVQPNISEWGMMINDARPYFRSIPSLIMCPGLLIFFTVFSLNIVGEYFDKKSRVMEWKK